MRHWAAVLGLAALVGSPALAQSSGELCAAGCLSQFGPEGSPAYNQCLNARCMHSEGVEAPPASPWAFIDPLMAQSLDIRPGDLPATLFVDHADPGTAQLGLAFHYPPNRSGGNSFGITVGLFARAADGWRFAGPVDNLFGIDPRDPVFLGGQVEITTTMQGPNDPRCCPTEEARWTINVTSRQARRIR